MRRKTLDIPFHLKAIGDDGFFSGYGSVFEVVDSAREVVKAGAFLKTLDEWKAAGRLPPILWNHNQDEPIGVYTAMHEDEHGLQVEGRLLVDDVRRARETHALMKANAVSGLSIGYSVKRAEDAERGGVRRLLELKLFECSVVPFPANDAARIDAVKAALDLGELPTLPQFERFLRDAGFSKSQATAVASGGLARLLRSESDNAPADRVSQALMILKNQELRP